MLSHHTLLRSKIGATMKLLVLLLFGVVGTTLGIMLTEGMIQSVFRFAFFGVIGVALLSQTIDF